MVAVALMMVATSLCLCINLGDEPASDGVTAVSEPTGAGGEVYDTDWATWDYDFVVPFHSPYYWRIQGTTLEVKGYYNPWLENPFAPYFPESSPWVDVVGQYYIKKVVITDTNAKYATNCFPKTRNVEEIVVDATSIEDMTGSFPDCAWNTVKKITAPDTVGWATEGVPWVNWTDMMEFHITRGAEERTDDFTTTNARLPWRTTSYADRAVVYIDDDIRCWKYMFKNTTLAPFTLTPDMHIEYASFWNWKAVPYETYNVYIDNPDTVRKVYSPVESVEPGVMSIRFLSNGTASEITEMGECIWNSLDASANMQFSVDSSVKVIPANMFKNMHFGPNFQVYADFEYIGHEAFKGGFIYDWYFGPSDGVLSIPTDTSAFQDVTFSEKCRQITIKASSVETLVFANTNITKLTVAPDTTRNMYIGDRVFWNCGDLQEVTFTSNCENLALGEKTFEGTNVWFVTMYKSLWDNLGNITPANDSEYNLLSNSKASLIVYAPNSNWDIKVWMGEGAMVTHNKSPETLVFEGDYSNVPQYEPSGAKRNPLSDVKTAVANAEFIFRHDAGDNTNALLPSGYASNASTMRFEIPAPNHAGSIGVTAPNVTEVYVDMGGDYEFVRLNGNTNTIKFIFSGANGRDYSDTSVNRLMWNVASECECEFDASVTHIGNYMFFGNKCQSFDLSNTALDSIGEYAFRGCKLTEINLPDTVQSIGTACFENCADLKAFRVPASCTDMGSFAFSRCHLDTFEFANTGYVSFSSPFASGTIHTIIIGPTASFPDGTTFNNTQHHFVISYNSAYFAEPGTSGFSGLFTDPKVNVFGIDGDVGYKGFAGSKYEWGYTIADETFYLLKAEDGSAYEDDPRGWTAPSFTTRHVVCDIATASNYYLSYIPFIQDEFVETIVFGEDFLGCVAEGCFDVPNLLEITVNTAMTYEDGAFGDGPFDLRSITIIPSSGTGVAVVEETELPWKTSNADVVAIDFTTCTKIPAYMFGDSVARYGIVYVPSTILSMEHTFEFSSGLTGLVFEDRSADFTGYGAFRYCTHLNEVYFYGNGWLFHCFENNFDGDEIKYVQSHNSNLIPVPGSGALDGIADMKTTVEYYDGQVETALGYRGAYLSWHNDENLNHYEEGTLGTSRPYDFSPTFPLESLDAQYRVIYINWVADDDYYSISNIFANSALSNLTAIYFAPSFKGVIEDSFTNAPILNTVVINESMSVRGYAFGTSGLTEVRLIASDNPEVVGNYDGALPIWKDIPVEIDFIVEDGVSVIPRHLFSSEESVALSSFNLPQSLKLIGEWAFNGVDTPFEELILPAGIEVERDAFRDVTINYMELRAGTYHAHAFAYSDIGGCVLVEDGIGYEPETFLVVDTEKVLNLTDQTLTAGTMQFGGLVSNRYCQISNGFTAPAIVQKMSGPSESQNVLVKLLWIVIAFIALAILVFLARAIMKKRGEYDD